MKSKHLLIAGVICAVAIAVLMVAMKGDARPDDTDTAAPTPTEDPVAPDVRTASERPALPTSRPPTRSGVGTAPMPPDPTNLKPEDIAPPRPDRKPITDSTKTAMRKRAVTLLDSRITALQKAVSQARARGNTSQATKLQVRLERTKAHRDLRARELEEPTQDGVEAGDNPQSHKPAAPHAPH